MLGKKAPILVSCFPSNCDENSISPASIPRKEIYKKMSLKTFADLYDCERHFEASRELAQISAEEKSQIPPEVISTLENKLGWLDRTIQETGTWVPSSVDHRGHGVYTRKDPNCPLHSFRVCGEVPVSII